LRMPKLQENCHNTESSCVIATRDSQFLQNEQVKTLKNVLKKLFTSKMKKKRRTREAKTKSSVWDLKNA